MRVNLANNFYEPDERAALENYTPEELEILAGNGRPCYKIAIYREHANREGMRDILLKEIEAGGTYLEPSIQAWLGEQHEQLKQDFYKWAEQYRQNNLPEESEFDLAPGLKLIEKFGGTYDRILGVPNRGLFLTYLFSKVDDRTNVLVPGVLEDITNRPGLKIAVVDQEYTPRHENIARELRYLNPLRLDLILYDDTLAGSQIQAANTPYDAVFGAKHLSSRMLPSALSNLERRLEQEPSSTYRA